MSFVKEREIGTVYSFPVHFRAEDRIGYDGIKRTECMFVIKKPEKDIVIMANPPVKVREVPRENIMDDTVELDEWDVEQLYHDYQDTLVNAAAPKI